MPGFIEIGEVLWRCWRRNDRKPTGGFRNIHGAKVPRVTLPNAKTRSNSRHHAHASSGPCPRFQCDLYGYCRIIGVTVQLYSLVDDLTISRGRRGEQYLSYHLHCERHYDRQMTNDFVKMSSVSKFTKPLQYGYCPSQCLSSHRFNP
jgi:hypothetical protein